MSEMLEEIDELEDEIQGLRMRLIDLQHEYLAGQEWLIEDNSGDDFMSMFMYYKHDFITMDADHAMEHEAELSNNIGE